MAVKVWTAGELTSAARSHARAEEQDDGDFAAYFNVIVKLSERAHGRGDGVAVYVNNDLGHPDIGQWQVVTYGSSAAQLETRGGRYDVSGHHEPFAHAADQIPTTLPDIGGRINYRYSLEAICPPSLTEKV